MRFDVVVPFQDMSPIVLITAASPWLPAARLANTLKSAGFVVHAFCPPEHPLRKSTSVERVHSYSALSPVRSLQKAITFSRPDLVIPGDDVSIDYLHQAYETCLKTAEQEIVVRRCVERIFGSRESFSILRSRSRFIQVAAEEGIRVPVTEEIKDVEDLKRWFRSNRLPVVLKANGTSGGEGVVRADNLKEAKEAFNSLQASPLLARAVKRAMLDHDKTLLWPSITRRKFVVNAQSFIAGREATSLIACWEGRALAKLHFEVIQKRSDSGPATVLRLIENDEMSAAADRIVRRLGLSGFHGLDFMLQESTGDAYLIEINPRNTQVGHLTFGLHRNLPVALYSAITDTPPIPFPAVTDGQLIALFPNEWMRDPSSNFLPSAYHDVPWDEPALMQVGIEQAQRVHKSDLGGNRPVVGIAAFLRRIWSPTPTANVMVSCRTAENEESVSQIS